MSRFSSSGFLGATLLVFTFALGAQDRAAIGAVLDISGPVYLRLASTGTEITLDPKKDLVRPLFPDQTVRCGPRGRLRLVVAGEVKVLQEADGPLMLRAQEALTPSQAKVLDALRHYGTPAGTRNVMSAIYSPPNGGAVSLGRLQIRWIGQVVKGAITLRLHADDGTLVWSATNVGVSIPQLPAEATTALRQALERFQTSRGSPKYTLTLTDSDGGEAGVTFWTLSRSAEGALSEDLRQWDQEPDAMLRAIGRAYAFNARNLFAEAADEYDSALKLAGDSESLVLAAIAAHRRTGNMQRASELSHLLQRK